MLLCLDIGNSHICGGVFAGQQLLLQFRYDSTQVGTSDEFGVFVRSVLRENDIDYRCISKVGIASVVPRIDYTVRAMCIKYLQLQPLFLNFGVNTGIEIKTHNPREVGADLIAAAMATKIIYPNQDVLVFDLGTATTCCYINAAGEYMGGAIAPGIRLMVDSLRSGTAKLFGVDIVKPRAAIGKNTPGAMQSGIYYAQLGFIEQLIAHTMQENALKTRPVILATGGFSHLFIDSNIFSNHIPELVLLGIKHMLELN